MNTPNPKEKPGKSRLSRRNFLIAAGVLGAGLVVAVRAGVPYARLRLAEFIEGSGGFGQGIQAAATTWFEITPEGQVRIYLPKVEMGQGVHTALAQIAAEELEVAWDSIETVQAGTGQGLDDSMGTAASNSVSSLYAPLREAAATMRVMLIAAGARQLGVEPQALTAREGSVFVTGNPETHLSYGEIVAREDPQNWEPPADPPPLKNPANFHTIGKPLPRVDLRDKILGTAVYGYDARLPGMLYGAVARPPRVQARLQQAAAGEASQVPGVVQVVIKEGFAGVVAESRQQAYAGLDAMELIWDEGPDWQQEQIERIVTVGQGERVVIQKEGNPDRYLQGDGVITAEYRTPMAFHAHLEPQAALADVQAGQVKVWASTQSANRLQGMIAEALQREPEEVTVMPTYLGGGFGRKVGEEAAVEAARLSAAAGRPVHVGWNRTEDFRNGFVRPPTHHVLRGAFDDQARLRAVEHQQSSGPVAFPFLPGFLSTVMGADFGSWRGAFVQYEIPDRQTVAWLSELPVYTGWWRGLGLMANIFALESFIDELAAAAGSDPLDFRLAHLPAGELGERYQNVLQAAAEQSGWNTPLPAGRGRGLAVCADAGTVVAEVAEVEVREGEIRVVKVTAAVDPGLVINPDGAAAQTEGAITMGLSSTLIEEAILQDGVLQAANFNRYPLLTQRQTPDIEVVLLQSGETPYGMGEPPIGPIAAAVANGVFAATGQRLRRLPLRLN